MFKPQIQSASEVFQTPDLSDLTTFDFTTEHNQERSKFSNVLPLARGGDYLTEFDLICAPIMNGRKVEFFATGKLYSWSHGYATILGNDGIFYHTPISAIEDAALLIAPVVVDESIVREMEEWVAYVISLEEQIAA
jgi:hypothetical protein